MSDERGVGQPSKYKPEFCDLLIDHMATGLSFESFAAVVGVHRDTLYEWEKVHPEFAEAKKLAFDQCLLTWEKIGIGNIINKESRSLNASIWIFNMKNRFKWRDKQADETDVVVNNNNNFSNTPDNELDQILREKLEKLQAKK
jgi:transposase